VVNRGGGGSGRRSCSGCGSRDRGTPDVLDRDSDAYLDVSWQPGADLQVCVSDMSLTISGRGRSMASRVALGPCRFVGGRRRRRAGRGALGSRVGVCGCHRGRCRGATDLRAEDRRTLRSIGGPKPALAGVLASALATV
jgi:hypothetical protein